jgi:hypothetical protein
VPPSDPCAGLQQGYYCSGKGFISCTDTYGDGCISSDFLLPYISCPSLQSCVGPQDSPWCL